MSCQIRRGGQTFVLGQKISESIFIEYPQNNNVFENISGGIYEMLVNHFRRVGYKIVSRRGEAYTLKVLIKNLEPNQKYVSPDILLFHQNIRIELFCQLLNYKMEPVASKIFTFNRLISKPKNPTLNSDFLIYEYKKMMQRASPKIEQHFRKFLLKK